MPGDWLAAVTDPQRTSAPFHAAHSPRGEGRGGQTAEARHINIVLRVLGSVLRTMLIRSHFQPLARRVAGGFCVLVDWDSPC